MLLAHPAAFAETTEAAPPTSGSEDSSAPARPLRFGASLQGMVVGSFISEPPEDEKVIDNYQIPYGGFAGVGGGWGLTLSATWEEWVGLELGLLSVSASGEGKINVGPGAITHEVTTSSIHIPILLVLSAPFESVKPQLFFGPSWVLPNEISFETSPENIAEVFNARGDSYFAWHFGFGLEIRLPISGIDLRIPVRLHGIYNPEVGDSIDSRIATFAVSPQTASSPAESRTDYLIEWEWQAAVSLGLSYVY